MLKSFIKSFRISRIVTFFEATKRKKYNNFYQNDLTETEWKYITKVLNLQESKRKYDLRTIWNAIFYLVKTSCQWCMLPKELPKWESVYYYYRKLASLDEFDLLLERLHGNVRVISGQHQEPSVGIVDSQSVK